MPAEPFAQALARKGDGEETAREAERHHEDLRRDLHVVDPHAHLAEVDLRQRTRAVSKRTVAFGAAFWRSGTTARRTMITEPVKPRSHNSR